MAKKTSKTAENKKAKTTSTRAKKQTQAPVVDTKPTLTPKLIVAQRKFNRWYVYFKGVAPKDNVGCGCKTAQSAIRYMHLLKARYGAVISQKIYDRLAFEAATAASSALTVSMFFFEHNKYALQSFILHRLSFSL